MRVFGTEGRGRRWVRYVVAASLPVAVAVAAAAEIPRAQAQGRVIHMAAVEMKGGHPKGEGTLPGNAPATRRRLRQNSTERRRPVGGLRLPVVARDDRGRAGRDGDARDCWGKRGCAPGHDP